MSIQSTRTIKRETAINRITEIVKLIEDADWVVLYKKIEDEEECYKEDFVNELNDIYKVYLEYNKIFKEVAKWPSKYLETFMDKPCIRFSFLDNYFIED